MENMDRVTESMARIEQEPGMAAWEETHFPLWEKQVIRSKQLWQAELEQRDHERLMRDAVEAD
jgi:hypothetical protein